MTSTYLAYIFGTLFALCIPVIIILLGRKQSNTAVSTLHSAADVAKFYNSTTDKFLQVYGEVIQAFRTTNVNDYLGYTLQSAELQNGQLILDAGCGIGGPASYFASKLEVRIEGLTISDVQANKAKEIIGNKVLKGSVNIRTGDYHFMDKIYGPEAFDRVLFLESFGHSPDQITLLAKAFQVLKPGGILYIKDLFKRECAEQADQQKVDEIISTINKEYCYNVADLHEILTALRRLNFILLCIKTPEIKTGEFEHLTISNDFQELFDIAKIISWENYIFPIDFFEIKVMKPPFDISIQKHLYFLNRPEIVQTV